VYERWVLYENEVLNELNVPRVNEMPPLQDLQ